MQSTNGRSIGPFGRRELFRLGSTLLLAAGATTRPVLRASSGQAGLPARVRSVRALTFDVFARWSTGGRA